MTSTLALTPSKQHFTSENNKDLAKHIGICSILTYLPSHIDIFLCCSGEDRSTFKEIAKNSTHSILAACGIKHRKSMVSAGIEPPDSCPHDWDNGPAHLLKACCSSCFSSFVEDVVQKLIGAAP